ncbi:MAG TPA: adenylate cyclase regulatory domain-containing protein [Acidimicrobiales bacterium]|nr:adenylate cyclase regulatory domain-containing protein [Acidimicrobiales bacterium]
MDTGPWERAGLYDPNDANADDRRALLEFLSERGATIDQMVEAHRQGSLPAVASDIVVRGDDRLVPVKEVAARSGISLERVLRVLLSTGLPVEADTEVSEHVIDLLSAFETGSDLMGDEAILAFTRVLGAAAIQIAEAAVALFYSELGPGTEREGQDELTRAKLAEAATLVFTAVPNVLAQMVMDQFERSLRRAVIVRGSWEPETGAATTDQVQTVTPDATTELVALGFVDLVGSTAWAEGLNLRDQSLALSRFESAAWSSAIPSGGRIVKMIGDEVFFAAPSADAACRIGIDVIRAAAEDDVLPPARGAVGLGSATPREGDYFGPLVNLLSRMVKTGAPGQLVVTEPTVAALAPDDWTVLPLEVDDLRGIDHPVKAFVVEPRTAPHPTERSGPPASDRII